MATTISVNGADGATLARSTGIRLVEDGSQALVLRDQHSVTRHGQPGTNAPQAIPGGPGGTLAIQLSESQLSQGAIHVHLVDTSQPHSLPPDTELPIGRELRLTAVGGIGETGNNGGDGQHGLDGVDGTPASKGSDATNGTNGGDGGAAGRGSSGADGGPGGDIHIFVDESSTHLLMSVSWDVRGGIGGRAGIHGSPGEGGRGGRGGMGWQWDEIVGYKYYCTDSCIRAAGHVPTSALARAGTQINASRSRVGASAMAMMAPMGARVVSGNNLERFIAQAAVAYSAARTPRTDPGACKCGGGSGNCAGCDLKPIRSYFKRAPGLDGKDGESGASMTTPLVKGWRGGEGTVTIAVQHHNGDTLRYTSSWALELVSFEIEDDNDDGIFEPGDFLHIRRVTVRNVGGMPTPTVPIPVRLAEHSHHFEELSSEDGGIAFLPTSIPSTGEASMEGSIKVRIKPNTWIPAHGIRFSETGWVQIRADMPWLEKRMPSFQVRNDINISYPCGFGDFDHLSTVAQSSTSRISYDIQNLGNQPIGGTEASVGQLPRAIEVVVSMPHAFGQLVSATGANAADITETVPRIRPRDTISMQQQIRIAQHAQDHGHFFIRFDLYLEAPQQSWDDLQDMVLIERRVVKLQVSSTYTRTANAKFLLVTNPKTTERQSHAVQRFIQTSLHMDVDLCNIHQNGGLTYSPEPASVPGLDESVSVLQSYKDKTVVFLDNPFEFFSCGEKTAAQFCDASWLRDLMNNDSSALFIGTPKDSDFSLRIRHAVFVVSSKYEHILKHIKAARVFTLPEQFVDSIVQERELGVQSSGLAAVTMKRRKWYHGRRPKVEREAKALVAYLRNRLPNERFMVSHDGVDHMIINTGLSHHHFLRSIESEITLRPARDADPRLSQLDRYSKYMLIASIPFRQRIDMLWRNTAVSAYVTSAIQLSILQDIADQVHGLHHSKYRKLLRSAKDDAKALKTLMRTHLPLLDDLLGHSNADESTQPPETVVHLLQWTLALSSSLKRHKSLGSLIDQSLRNHVSTAYLPDDPNFRTGISSSDPDHLIDQISVLTEMPSYVLEKGYVSARQIVPTTEYYTPQEWNNMAASMEREQQRLYSDMNAAKKELGRLVTEPVASSVDIAMEMSA